MLQQRSPGCLRYAESLLDPQAPEDGLLSDHVDAIVVGAGIVGLAAARALALQGKDVIVLERRSYAGAETSSRNSGVIHSGIYYPAGSLKASLCVRGRAMLYEYCMTRDIPHKRCGKLIVAQESQVPRLRALAEAGSRNGVSDLQWLDAAGARALEPDVRCTAAIWSPSTGIVDVHDYLHALQADIEASGGVVIFGTEFESAAVIKSGFEVAARTDGESSVMCCRRLINAAGVGAPLLLSRISGYPQALLRKPYYAKGNYFSCRGASPFRHLVYPMPGEAGLGVHATLDLSGRTRFGPDVEWVSEIAYDVDPSRCASFYEAIREYWPGLPDDALQPDFAGIRPKITGPGEPAADFVIEGGDTHGVPGLVNLLGIESPGLTASLAIGERVAGIS
jgi:L-2-hydroxyglutarate oxidase LhgO